MSQDAQTPEQWKRKYYDSLDEFDQKEKQWARTEEVLRRALSRLSLAADGQLPALDQHLVQLRSTLRDKAGSAMINQRIEAMSDALMQLDQIKKKSTSNRPGAAAALGKLLAGLKLSGEMARKVKALQTEVAALPADAWPESQLDAAIALLRGALSSEVAPAAADTDKPGLFARLLKRPEAAPATGSDNGHAPLQALVGALKLPDAQQGAVKRVAAHIDKARDSAALQELARELAGIWNDSAGAPATLSVDEALLQLLERLSLPADMAPRVEQLKTHIDDGNTARDWSRTLDDVAELIADLRAEAQREKRELESFLQQVTENLQELDQSLRGTEDIRKAAAADSDALDKAVQDQVRDIESSVREATELSQLKLTIQQRLDAIREHMQAYRDQTQARDQQADQEMQALTQRLQSLEGESEQLRARIRAERATAMQDSLTGIPNRLAYDERIAAEFARWKRFNTPLSLLVWDVDHFKRINDTYGHKAGDKVLTTIAQTLHGQIRETDFIARYGGEEFVMIITGADPRSAFEVADKLRLSIETCGFHFRGSAVPITISCGIAHFNGSSDTPEQVFERADKALYQAKQQGRNRCSEA